MNKGIIIGIIIALAIAIGFGAFMTSENPIQTTEPEITTDTEESIPKTEEAPAPRHFTVELNESIGVKTPP